MPAWVVDLLNRLNSTFVVDGRWQWFVSGLGYTLLISLFSNVHIDKWVVGFIAFGINSGAYIAEIVRGGILSVNIGQTEAGRSLGMTHKQTMASIVMPQAMKNILPALGNEFVVLIKETAVIGMIANIDLVGAARKVQSLTYDYLIPLLSIAVIYYVVIKIISTLLSKVEKGMRKADKR